jgi:hypothetical protein
MKAELMVGLREAEPGVARAGPMVGWKVVMTAGTMVAHLEEYLEAQQVGPQVEYWVEGRAE